MMGAPGIDQHAVAPIRLPAIVEIMQQPHMVPVDMDGMGKAAAVDQAQRHRRAGFHRKQRLAGYAAGRRAIDRPDMRRVGPGAGLDHQIKLP